MIVYKISNTITGDFYIGKTKNNIEKRWYQHCKDAEYRRNPNSRLYHAIRKYGKGFFKHEILANAQTLFELNQLEIRLIAEHKPAYNIAEGGNGGWINDQTGKRWKIKDTSKMSAAKIGRSRPKALIEAISGGNNYQSTHRIHTPWGVFVTYLDAIKEAKRLRAEGNKAVVVCATTLRKYCESNVRLNIEGRRVCAVWRGRYTTEIGFYRSIK